MQFFSSTAGHWCSINTTDKKLEDFLAGCEFYNRPLSKVYCTKLNMAGQSFDCPLQSIYWGVFGHSKVKQLKCHSSPQFQASIIKTIQTKEQDDHSSHLPLNSSLALQELQCPSDLTLTNPTSLKSSATHLLACLFVALNNHFSKLGFSQPSSRSTHYYMPKLD